MTEVMEKYIDKILKEENTHIYDIPFDVRTSCRITSYNVCYTKLLRLFERERWEGVMANMDTQIFLGSTEQSCHEYFSKALGKATIDYKTRGYSRGMRGNTNENIQITGRERNNFV